ncbi:EF_hand domain-containing protein [Hexamita inflata]|uniref:EF hand domain-containing protein n=1 Tax=Hexamita inflata TaxID=28002 RepID=A0AA86PJF3_9EUKA|nr:EF hand domain-containing protein [Hexamita inflata]
MGATLCQQTPNRETETIVSKYRALFQKYKTMDSETITNQQIIQILSQIKCQTNQKYFQQTFDMLDGDQDGELSFEEFCHFLYTCEKSLLKNTHDIMFYLCDANYQDQISKEQLLQVFDQLNQKLPNKIAFKLEEQFSEQDMRLTLIEFHLIIAEIEAEIYESLSCEELQ